MPILSVSGPSCAGKSTLLTGLARCLTVVPLLSYTTRERRPTDTTDGEYRFVSDAEFDEMECVGAFLWTVAPHGLPYRYGTRRVDVDVALASNLWHVPLLTLDAVRALHVYSFLKGKKARARALYLRITDEDELRRRFQARGDTDPANIAARLAGVRKDLEDAQTLGVRMRFVNAERKPDEVLHDVAAYMQPPPR